MPPSSAKLFVFTVSSGLLFLFSGFVAGFPSVPMAVLAVMAGVFMFACTKFVADKAMLSWAASLCYVVSYLIMIELVSDRVVVASLQLFMLISFFSGLLLWLASHKERGTDVPPTRTRN